MPDALASPAEPPRTTISAPAPPGRLRRIGARVRWLAPVASLLPVAGAVWWVQTFDPTNGKVGPLGPDAWHALVGVNGPGCGGTRAFYYLIHADLVDAVRMHLPFVLAVPFLAYWWMGWAAATVGIRLPALKLRGSWLIAYGVFFLLFTTVLRNLPIEPFAWFDIPSATHRIW